MRRPLPNTINYTDCTRPLSGSRRNRYVRIIVRRKLLYTGSTEDHRNASAAPDRAAEFGRAGCGYSSRPITTRLSGRGSESRKSSHANGRGRRSHFLRYDKSAHTTTRPIPGNIISAVKITDAVVVPLDSSSCVKLRHRRGTPPHPFYHLPGILLSVAAGCEIIKFGRNRSYFQQNTLIQYDFCIFATSIIRTMPVPDTNLHHRFNPTKTSPNVAGIVLSLFPVRRVSAKTAASHRASSVNYIIGSRNNFQFIPLIIRNKRYLLQVSGSSAFYSE